MFTVANTSPSTHPSANMFAPTPNPPHPPHNPTPLIYYEKTSYEIDEIVSWDRIFL